MHGEALYYAGVCYHTGTGVAKDPVQVPCVTNWSRVNLHGIPRRIELCISCIASAKPRLFCFSLFSSTSTESPIHTGRLMRPCKQLWMSERVGRRLCCPHSHCQPWPRPSSHKAHSPLRPRMFTPFLSTAPKRSIPPSTRPRPQPTVYCPRRAPATLALSPCRPSLPRSLLPRPLSQATLPVQSRSCPHGTYPRPASPRRNTTSLDTASGDLVSDDLHRASAPGSGNGIHSCVHGP